MGEFPSDFVGGGGGGEVGEGFVEEWGFVRRDCAGEWGGGGGVVRKLSVKGRGGFVGAESIGSMILSGESGGVIGGFL